MFKQLRRLLLITPMLMASTMSQAKPQVLDNVVAVANDEVITQSQLNHQVELIKANLNKQHTALPPANILRKQVLEHMITTSLQKQLAEKYGIKVSEQEVDSAIANIAASQHMSVEQLKSAVAADDMNYSDFRQQIQDQIMVQHIQQVALQDKIRITDQEVDDYMRLLKAQTAQPSAYHIQDILIALPESPTSKQIQAAKQRADNIMQQLHKGTSFDQLAVAESAGEEALQRGDLGWRKLAELPTLFADRVKTMQKGDIAGPLRADNGFHIIKVDNIRGDKEKHYVKEAEVSQIYLKPDSSYPAKVYQQKLSKLRNEALKGADFAKLAETYSDDPVTASKGGNMGWINLSMVSPEFADVVNKLKAGQISQPFQTAAGWHLVKLSKHRHVEDTTQYKRDQVKGMIYQRKFNEQAQTWIWQLRNSAYVKILDKSLIAKQD